MPRKNRRLVPEPVEVITVDLSYLSLAGAAPQLEVLDIAADADLVVLIKPMYELGLSAPPADPALCHKAVEMAITGVERCGWELRRSMPSPIPGGHGATEHLAHCHRR